MGGNKPAQRTKNNARPASSGRSAELLSGGGSLFPTLREEAPALHLDGPLLLCVKKLQKKDPITKIKALQELCSLVKDPSLSTCEVEEVLQYWARVYPALSLDDDHKLREATQRAHGAVVRAAGRGTARVLRSVCGAWLAGEGDAYEPAAREARRALRDVLPGGRRAGMVAHCRADLAQYGVTRVRVRPGCAAAREAAAGARVVAVLCRELPEEMRAWLSAEDALGPLLRLDTAPWGGLPASWDDAAWRAWLEAAAALLAAASPPPESPLWKTAAELALRECHAGLLSACLLARPELPVWTRDSRLGSCAVRLPGDPTLWPLLPRNVRNESLYVRCTAALLDGMNERGASRVEVGERAARLCEVLFIAGREGELPAGVGRRLMVECCIRAAQEGGRAAEELCARLPSLLRRREPDPHFWTDLAKLLADMRETEPVARAANFMIQLAGSVVEDRDRPRSVRFRDEERPRDLLEGTQLALLEDAAALVCRRWIREDKTTAAACQLACRFASSTWADKLAGGGSLAALCGELCARLSGPPELHTSLASVLFLLLPHISEQQQTNIFRNMEQLPEEAVATCAVLCARRELRDITAGQMFLRGDAVAGAVRAAVYSVLRGGEGDELVRAVGGTCRRPELVRLLGEGLLGCEQEAVGRAAVLLGELLTEHPDVDGALALLRLELTLLVQQDSEQTADTVRAVWTALPSTLLSELAAQAAPLLHAHMSDPDQIALLGGELVRRTGRGTMDELLPAMWHTDSAQVAMLALRHEAVCGRLHCPLTGPDLAALPPLLDPPDVALLDRHTRRCMFRAALLLSVPTEPRDPHLLHALHDLAALQGLSTCLDLWPHDDAVREACVQLQEMCGRAVECGAADVEGRAILLRELEERAAREGRFWAVALSTWGDGRQEGARGTTTVGDVVSGDGLFHRLQVDAKGEEQARDVARLLMYRALYVAHGADERILPPDFPLVMVAVDRDEQLQLALDAHQRSLAIWPADLTDRCAWPFVTSRVALLDMLRLELRPSAPAPLLDFASVSLCDTLDTVSAAAPHWTLPAVAALGGAAFRLRRALSDFMEVGADESRAAEWREVFEPEVTRRLLALAARLLLEAAPAELRLCCADALRGTSWARLPPALRASMPLSELASNCARGVMPPAPPAAHHLAAALLDVLADSLLVHDASQLAEWAGQGAECDGGESGEVEDEGEHVEERAPPPPLFLHHLCPHYDDLLTHADRVLTTVKLSEESWCDVSDSTERRCAVRGWLVLQRAVLCVATRATGDLAQRYSAELARAPRPDLLARNLLRLLPSELLQHPAPAPHRLEALADLFWGHDGPPDVSAPVAHLACDTLRRALCGPGGAGLRGWWGAAGTREASCAERVVRACVSPRLVRTQLAELRRRASGWRDVDVQVAESTREVRATMPVDDRSVELWLQLSERHPLGGARADREWVRVYVDVRGGAPWAAVRLWADSARRRLERTGPCYICYSRLHADTGRLPARPCPACRNKYHKECINKWFATNHNYTCPLCRSPMPH